MITKIEFCVNDPITSSNAFEVSTNIGILENGEAIYRSRLASNKIKSGQTLNTLQIFIEIY
jgi:hypothetical protein